MEKNTQKTTTVVQGYVSKPNQVLVFAILTNVTSNTFNFKKYIR